VGKIAKKQS